MKRFALASAAILLVLFVGLGLGLACGAIRAVIVGSSDRGPQEFDHAASAEAKALVGRALAGLDQSELFDVHAHVAGSEADASGCELNPEMRSFLHPWRRFQLWVYLSAAHVEHLETGATEFAQRLLEVTRGRVGILALDRRHRTDGSVDREGTALYVPNDHVLGLAEEHGDRFFPVVSVHPYREGALQELDRCAARGAKLVKWLPNAMGIDPSDQRCDPFYARMKLRGMTLLAHTGEETALAAGEDELGNPLRLRRALAAGVRVIFAHCASLGESQDLDDPSQRRIASFDLFLRVMDDPRWRDLAYGDLSAVCFRTRETRVLRTLLERKDLHTRLIEGSDWPLPAIRIATSTRNFEREGFLTREERTALDEVFGYNPWLFDLVLKRTVRGPNGERFPDSVFLARPELLP
jgi:predicted TIM-barrel fold metal-dependent hydrolase